MAAECTFQPNIVFTKREYSDVAGRLKRDLKK
jgi:hypothetical protein